MALQSQNLVLAGIGVLNDSPPNDFQPRLPDGIHLRWAFKHEIGFPWYGYYLFRRPHSKERDQVCLTDMLRRLRPGSVASQTLNTPLGQVVSDQNIVLTDDFPPAGAVELDLDQRTFLRFVLPPNEPAYQVEVQVGFRGEPTDLECINFREVNPEEEANPWKLQDVVFEVFDSAGNLRKPPMLISIGQGFGLNCGFQTVITLPCPAFYVTLALAHSASPAKIDAFDESGSIVAEAMMTAGNGVLETITLTTEKGIVQLVIHAPQNETVLQEICYSCSADGDNDQSKIRVRALMGSTPVDEAVLSGFPGQIVSAQLAFDTITAVEFSSGQAAVIDICFNLISRGALRGWEMLRDFPYPMCLPVAHSDYPCISKPSTQPQAEDVAVGRVHYGDPDVWRGASFDDLHGQLELLVENGPPPLGDPMALREVSVTGVPETPGSETPPVMPHQRPLDLVLVGSLNAAIAQMIGLYWLDQTVDKDEGYDYFILADHTNVFGGSPEKALSWLASGPDFTVVDGYIIFNRRLGDAYTLSAPTDLRAYALPGSTMQTESGDLLDATNNAGLRWNLGYFGDILLPDRAVMYHLWRTNLGGSEPAPGSPPPTNQYDPVTKEQPIVVAWAEIPPGVTPETPVDWPPFMLHAIDRALPEGWYSYRINGIDIFGRHSIHSAPGRWFQWSPMPNPRPWYYRDPPGDTVIHPFAVGLLDKTPPPPPTMIEAYALDPNDPTLLKDDAFDTWWATLTPTEQNNLIGLRVRWLWTQAHMRQAPDIDEFRIYYQPGHLNALLGHTTTVTAAGSTESLVGTDIANTAAANTFVGAWLRIGPDAFEITGSQPGTPLQLRVQNIGPTDNIPPKSAAPCTIVIPAGHALYKDYANAATWEDRYYVVLYDEHVTVTTDGAGQPLRQYDVFIPAPGDTDRSSIPLNPTLADPIVYAHVSVSATDDKTHTTDNPKWNADSWGNRTGNEGYVGAPATIFRVRRVQPNPPVPPPDAERVYASPADYHSHSFYTYRWVPQAHLKTHIYRALDDAVFKVDWEQQPRPALSASNLALFPAQADDPRWDALKRQQVVGELNTLNTFPKTDAGKTQALNFYRGLSNDALRVLAGLQGNERAFTQLTIQPLNPAQPDPDDPAQLRWRDRIGPDTDPNYTPSASLRAYIDTLDGRSTNRYFYRSAYADGAHNISVLSLSSPPIWLPNVVPPRAPVITKIFAGDANPTQPGDKKITIRWASNREVDLTEYRIYRADSETNARDLRLMTLVHTLAVPAGDPAARPAENTWTNSPVPARVGLFYRIVAIDEAGNISEPSPCATAQAYNQTPPDPPTWVSADWNAGGDAVDLVWTLADPTLQTIVQQRVFGVWQAVSPWLPPGTTSYSDTPGDPTVEHRYRLRVRDETGNVNFTYNETTVAPFGS